MSSYALQLCSVLWHIAAYILCALTVHLIKKVTFVTKETEYIIISHHCNVPHSLTLNLYLRSSVQNQVQHCFPDHQQGPAIISFQFENDELSTKN